MKDWWVRRDNTDTWFGPLSYRDANRHARVMTLDGTDLDVKYAQVGTIMGERPGDPATLPSRMFVAFLYVNGRMTLGGRAAEFHKDKLPFT